MTAWEPRDQNNRGNAIGGFIVGVLFGASLWYAAYLILKGVL